MIIKLSKELSLVLEESREMAPSRQDIKVGVKMGRGPGAGVGKAAS